MDYYPKNMKPLVIFEMANNHMGDTAHAIKIIRKYHDVAKPFKEKIDFAFKFQFRDLKTYIHSNFINSDNKQVKRFVETKLKESDWNKIFKFSKGKFKLICTAFDEPSVDKIVKLKFDYLKIASCSMNEWPLLEYISKKAKKKKIICSLGGAKKSEIRNIISFFRSRKMNIKYLFCVAKYPTKPENLNLSYFSHLRKIYGDIISGFSSHELPNEKLSGSIAYSMGARIFEKHVGLASKKYKLNKYSTSPNQMFDWLKNLDETILRAGSIKDREKFLKQEKDNLLVFKRGAFLRKNLSKNKGETLGISDVEFAFPNLRNQITSNEFSKFNKFTLKNKIKKNSPIFKKDVKIINTRSFVEKIRDKISILIDKSGVILKKNSKIEISHHYGLKNFKKFGMCMITILNSKYCKKLLFIFQKQRHPAQYHKKKQETFFILYGKVKLKITRNKVSKTQILKTGDIVTIYPKDIHSFSGLSKEGAVIEELSTKSMSSDSYYVDRQVNKNRKSLISLN